jgi:bone morphogenetic protein receptor type-2
MEYNAKNIPATLNTKDNSEYEDDTENEVGDENDVYLEQNFTDVQPAQSTCPNTNEFCFSAYQIRNDGSHKLLSQGCWEHHHQCNQSTCLGNQENKSEKMSIIFCCCNTDLCNNNLTSVTPQISPVVNLQPPSSNSNSSILRNPAVWVSFASTAIMLFIIAIVFFASCRVRTKAQPEASPLAPSGPGYSSNLYNVDNLKPISIIGEGK